mgnify:FL=1
MVTFEPQQLRIELRHYPVIKRLEKLISSDPDIQKYIKDELFQYLILNTLWSPQEGWYQPEPDSLILTIPIAVYPQRAVLPTLELLEKES